MYYYFVSLGILPKKRKQIKFVHMVAAKDCTINTNYINSTV